jgi:hypothetical protein
MALAADQNLRAIQQSPRRAAQALAPVLTDAQDRQPRGHGAGSSGAARALTAAAARALPPRRPRKVRNGTPWDEAHRKAQDRRWPRPALQQQLEQAEQRGWRIADRHHGARQMGPPKLDRGGRACGLAGLGQPGHRRVLQRAEHGVAGRQARPGHPIGHHAAVGDDRRAGGQRRPGGRHQVRAPGQIGHDLRHPAGVD